MLIATMFGRLAATIAKAYWRHSRDGINRIELTVCGRDYSVNLEALDKSDVERIEEVVAAVKKSQEIKKAEESA